MRTRTLVVSVALAMSGGTVAGCIGVPFASLGGRGRVAVAGAVGDLRSFGPRTAVQAHIGTAILSVTDPGPRDLDVEVGYALDAFPGERSLDRHGGYAGVHWFPWQDDGVRVSVGGDLDALWGFDQRLALGATLSVGIEGYAACEGAMGGGDVLYAGLLGWGRGEWGFGVQAQASYRFVDGEHYAMFGGSLSIRFPAGIGVGYVTALTFIELAGTSRSARAPEPSGAPAPGQGRQPVAPYGFCEHPLPSGAPGGEARMPEEDRWQCEARNEDDTEHESGYVRGLSQEEAVAACRRDFTIARADGSVCSCRAAP